ncbi:MAG TPA: hypothetical protein P5555_16640 [Candidatus Paceibacterota bacterium]|nr:hypothetical protein [Verrucomicrobiota bacterium]HOX03381.1 hypothetical protein [Verrucomicrobiota bacterium]HRZ46808.1 hypothetical protein [Candidatus Paceibacterota bacterium]
MKTDPSVQRSGRLWGNDWRMARGGAGLLLAVVLLAACPLAGAAPGGAVQWSADFEAAEPGKLPEGMLVVDGAFAVRLDGANKVLELPGNPLESYGVLFGPAESAGLEVSARIRGTRQGRRMPAFGVGLNGVGGFRLQASPARRALELFRDNRLLAQAPFTWQSSQWMQFRLRVRALDGQWRVEGKAWTTGQPEPADWMIRHMTSVQPPAGRASIWGFPFAGTPIQFDDLAVRAVPDEK